MVLKIKEIMRAETPTTCELRQGWGKLTRHTPEISVDIIYPDPFSLTAEGAHGCPAVIQYNPEDIPLEVEFEVPQNLPAKSKYRLVGAQWAGQAKEREGFEMVSAPFELPKGTKDMVAKGFKAANEIKAPDSPFRIQGKIMWYLVGEDSKPLSDKIPDFGSAVSHEFYFVLGPTHNLPHIINEWFRELNELVFPDFQKIAGKKWAEVEGFVLQNAVEKLYRLGSHDDLRYDSRRHEGGSPHHLKGKTVYLSTFFQKEKKLVNCFDLAAVLKLLLLSLGTRKTNSGGYENVIHGLAMTIDQPWGYIPPGPLFGWLRTEAHYCNNPFWWDEDPKKCLKPHVETFDPARTSFGKHCYVKFKNHLGKECAVDACHALADSKNPGKILLATGHQDIAQFREANTDVGPKRDDLPAGPPKVSENQLEAISRS
ncbi:hypothetical protein B0T26DRAFT_805075 [Lasiosphaeria miniovina]|uniref:Uncharacterized protein n=1 Tax=Lasiosphaeria miniovina TaxID=1954250 RepID=A0AA40A549_9PEZI|nr:uncharacterized protein B0T26DRAFT_805075 [Lasiosphaeria miniovina]KAK0709333.1 hypothetical protein B0T26DRAFT_805075 [Lasiosphaeria miniovina]